MSALFFLSLAVAFVAASDQQVIIPSFLAFPEPSASSPGNLTLEDAHRNIMTNMPAHRIIKSDDLHQYFGDNYGANHTIYVPDERSFINLASVNLHIPDEQSLLHALKPSASAEGGPTSAHAVARDHPTLPPICYSYTPRWTPQTGQWFGAWKPASACYRNGLSSVQNGQTLQWQSSLSVAENFNLDYTIIADILTVSLGITVTETWTKSDVWTCDIPPYSVGQIWESTYVAWGWFWSQGCQKCTNAPSGCGGSFGYNPRADGGATAPAINENGNPFQIGCSNGEANVKC